MYKIFCLERPHFLSSVLLIFLIVLGVIFLFKANNFFLIEFAAETEICCPIIELTSA